MNLARFQFSLTSQLIMFARMQWLQRFALTGCVAEAEELNNRLQTTKHRVSELERTLSTVSTQQKQFERVTYLKDLIMKLLNKDMV